MPFGALASRAEFTSFHSDLQLVLIGDAPISRALRYDLFILGQWRVIMLSKIRDQHHFINGIKMLIILKLGLND